jgi:hypothetical protein
MDSISDRQPRVLWAFWVAAGLAATGGIAPLVLTAGGTNRIAGVAIPFAIAAIAFAVDALSYQRGRPIATILYFVAGMALVYGMLSMFSVPLRLAVIGTCDPLPAACPAGLERPLSTGETSGFGFAIAMGTLAIFVGFFALLMLFRRRQPAATPPPVRRESPAFVPAAATATAPVSEAVTADDAAVSTVAEPAAVPELSAPAEREELPPHIEPAELPPHAPRAEPPAGTDSSS